MPDADPVVRPAVADEAQQEKPRKEQPKPVAPPAPAARPVRQARVRSRHLMAFLSFFLFVVGPTAVSAWYLWNRAYDRYVSEAGFSVRTEEMGPAIANLFGALGGMSGSSSSDTDILYRFITSPDLVRTVDSRVDLRAMWAKADPAVDPIYAYHPPGTIEDLVAYWRRMVKVYSDGAGLIDLEVQAFSADDALLLSEVIYEESSSMINELSAIARDDATRYARADLDEAEERVAAAREALTRFRNRTQIVDPQASIESQVGIISQLQGQLAQALVDLDLLEQSTSPGDPRISQTQRRIEAIEDRIELERAKFGFGSTDQSTSPQGEAFADLVGEYERLLAEREFAEASYAAARASFEAAVGEARRQSRYLAAHVRPTVAEAPTYPQRLTVVGLVLTFSMLTWAFLVLVGYALRDRR
ncbi:capsule biosynthesis protein [Histidinibacterium lentulum]|uniref:Capsule biosynthesis protein n=1 Tax=Histidinibacterium lentulum TaxID=2480588 RepID=A0A3N2R6F6_9RHOB|nr:capsule biosynthesis protein [Histidinibacterium lentulum]ROU02987.1 capsule biosynthesis protein [Histidinibacterium lentulum]